MIFFYNFIAYLKKNAKYQDHSIAISNSKMEYQILCKEKEPPYSFIPTNEVRHSSAPIEVKLVQIFISYQFGMR